MLCFLRRVSLRHPGTLVLKSPPHTARVRQLLDLFPNAKFIHIVRDPLAVFPSTVRLWKSLDDVQGLQVPTFDHLEERVLDDFCRMYDSFEADRQLIPPQNFYELHYEDLVKDPINHLHDLYQQLGLADFESVRAAHATYWDKQKSYQTNRHVVSPELEATVAQHWGKYMRKYGYLGGEQIREPALNQTNVLPLEARQSPAA